jgi:hypothetical protein
MLTTSRPHITIRRKDAAAVLATEIERHVTRVDGAIQIVGDGTFGQQCAARLCAVTRMTCDGLRRAGRNGFAAREVER